MLAVIAYPRSGLHPHIAFVASPFFLVYVAQIGLYRMSFGQLISISHQPTHAMPGSRWPVIALSSVARKQRGQLRFDARPVRSNRASGFLVRLRLLVRINPPTLLRFFFIFLFVLYSLFFRVLVFVYSLKIRAKTVCLYLDKDKDSKTRIK